MNQWLPPCLATPALADLPKCATVRNAWNFWFLWTSFSSVKSGCLERTGYCRLCQKEVILSLTTLAGGSNLAHLGDTWSPPIHGLYTFRAETNDSLDWGLPRPSERHHHQTMIENATERRLLTSTSTCLDVRMDATREAFHMMIYQKTLFQMLCHALLCKSVVLQGEAPNSCSYLIDQSQPYVNSSSTCWPEICHKSLGRYWPNQNDEIKQCSGSRSDNGGWKSRPGRSSLGPKRHFQGEKKEPFCPCVSRISTQRTTSNFLVCVHC